MEIMNRRCGMFKIVIENFIFLLLFATVVEQVTGFGFDSANSCSPNGKASRRGRAQMLATIPCDLTRQAYCHLPGTSYPWHAVRRFVHENQGLMKRMYGDVRHISILRDEIQNNDIDIEDVEVAAERYSRDGSRRSSKFMHSHGDAGATRNNDVLMEPHFRPMTTTTAQTTTSASNETTSERPPEIADEPLKNLTAENSEKLKVHVDDSNLESNSVYETQTETKMGENIEIIASPQLGAPNNTEAATISTTLKVVSTIKTETERPTAHRRPQPSRHRPASGQHQHQTHHKQPQQSLKLGSTILKESFNGKPKLNESERLPSSTTVKGTANKNSQYFSPTESTPATGTASPPAPATSPLSTPFAMLSPTTLATSLPLKPGGDLLTGEKRRKQPAAPANSPVTPSSTLMPSVSTAPAMATKPVLRDGQLFQDTVKQEPAPVANMRGINACPVKEEVVAPFWANNTRGEVLALLNLYPFEQYVHWEKCTHEHKQMYCRDGCRCEQQYRLHRLLAYDPHNECRGIFSDWFRFPSCCICKCYSNIPTEFRATSRSPRSERTFGEEQLRHPIELAEEIVQKAIYEHATEEWYRPRDEFDIYDG